MPGETPHPDIYQPLSHTGDLGILVYGNTVEELFAHAAWAMFDLMTDATTIRPQQTLSIDLTATDLEDLLVQWLSELLYLYDTQRLLCCAFTITTLQPRALSATVAGELFDATRHPIDTEIKAVTYHQLAIESLGTHWQARVIFDL